MGRRREEWQTEGRTVEVFERGRKREEDGEDRRKRGKERERDGLEIGREEG